MSLRLALLAICSCALFGQGNYEVQVYPGDTLKPGYTMIEWHTNLTVTGVKDMINGVLPTEHQFHETIEITQGITPWFETGFYIFTSIGNGQGWQWVGDHIRPRFAVPEEFHWPVGLSLSLEFGYQRARFSPDTFTLEIRPIIDKKLGRWYLAFNPTMDRSFHGPGIREGLNFSPNFKASYDITKKVAFGLEYYGALGPITGFDPIREQEQQIVPAIDIDFGPNWEFNLGVGVGVTQGTDHLLVKAIIGRRFNFHKK
jgi:hypothetical protein